jgi:hypothetical protein
MRLLIADKLHPRAVEELRTLPVDVVYEPELTKETLETTLTGVGILVVRSKEVTRKAIENAPPTTDGAPPLGVGMPGSGTPGLTTLDLTRLRLGAKGSGTPGLATADLGGDGFDTTGSGAVAFGGALGIVALDAAGLAGAESGNGAFGGGALDADGLVALGLALGVTDFGGEALDVAGLDFAPLPAPALAAAVLGMFTGTPLGPAPFVAAVFALPPLGPAVALEAAGLDAAVLDLALSLGFAPFAAGVVFDAAALDGAPFAAVDGATAFLPAAGLVAALLPADAFAPAFGAALDDALPDPPLAPDLPFFASAACASL